MEAPKYSRNTVHIKPLTSIAKFIKVADLVKAIMRREGASPDEVHSFDLAIRQGGWFGLVKAVQRWVNVAQ
jgi:hypothetical protein